MPTFDPCPTLLGQLRPELEGSHRGVRRIEVSSLRFLALNLPFELGINFTALGPAPPSVAQNIEIVIQCYRNRCRCWTLTEVDFKK